MRGPGPTASSLLHSVRTGGAEDELRWRVGFPAAAKHNDDVVIGKRAGE
jgi:hypothetical protein